MLAGGVNSDSAPTGSSRAIRHIKPETARAVRPAHSSALAWAIATDLRNDNPCDRVLPVLGPQGDIMQHMRALPHLDVAAAVETVQSAESAAPAVKLAWRDVETVAGCYTRGPTTTGAIPACGG